MKTEEKINTKKIIAESNKNQEQLSRLFGDLKKKDLSKKDKKEIISQLDDLEELALSLKNKLVNSQ